MLETFLSLHWLWYIPMYLATGVALTALLIALLPDSSDLYGIIVEDHSPPPEVLAVAWPIGVVALIITAFWLGISWLFEKAAAFDPAKLNPRHRFQKRKTKPQTEPAAVADAMPSWARWE